jgi:hypothetical protein
MSSREPAGAHLPHPRRGCVQRGTSLPATSGPTRGRNVVVGARYRGEQPVGSSDSGGRPISSTTVRKPARPLSRSTPWRSTSSRWPADTARLTALATCGWPPRRAPAPASSSASKSQPAGAVFGSAGIRIIRTLAPTPARWPHSPALRRDHPAPATRPARSPSARVRAGRMMWQGPRHPHGQI